MCPNRNIGIKNTSNSNLGGRYSISTNTFNGSPSVILPLGTNIVEDLFSSEL